MVAPVYLPYTSLNQFLNLVHSCVNLKKYLRLRRRMFIFFACDRQKKFSKISSAWSRRTLTLQKIQVFPWLLINCWRTTWNSNLGISSKRKCTHVEGIKLRVKINPCFFKDNLLHTEVFRPFSWTFFAMRKVDISNRSAMWRIGELR